VGFINFINAFKPGSKPRGTGIRYSQLKRPDWEREQDSMFEVTDSDEQEIRKREEREQ